MTVAQAVETKAETLARLAAEVHAYKGGRPYAVYITEGLLRLVNAEPGAFGEWAGWVLRGD